MSSKEEQKAMGAAAGAGAAVEGASADVNAAGAGAASAASAGAAGASTAAAAAAAAAVVASSAAGGSAAKAAVGAVAPDVISVSVHQQTAGWTTGAASGEAVGVMGRGLRIEAIALTLSAGMEGSVVYSVDRRGSGWTSWSGDGKPAGTVGKSSPILAVKVQLAGAPAETLDVWYRVWVGNYGWTGWAKNGMPAGTSASYAILEAVEVLVLKKGSEAPGDVEPALVESVPFTAEEAEKTEAEAKAEAEALARYDAVPVTLSVSVHQRNVGWTAGVASGRTAGITGEGLRIEAVRMNFSAEVDGTLAYCAECRDFGWTDWTSDGTLAGTTGRAQPIIAIKADLTGAAAKAFDVWYRVWVGNKGWTGWSKNGAVAGASASDEILEGVEVVVLEKGSAVPGSAPVGAPASAGAAGAASAGEGVSEAAAAGAAGGAAGAAGAEAGGAGMATDASSGAEKSANAGESAKPQPAAGSAVSFVPAEPEPESEPEPEVVIKFDDVTKTYRLYKDDKQRFLSIFWSKKKRDAIPCVNANDHLSFEVRRGDAVAFMGHNGAGKSTALKLVTGVAYPTSGTVTVNGQISALLEMTAGFDPNLTGRENIYMRGLALGMSKEEIAELEPKTVDFAELGAYIDQPYRSYSSGMRARLGFGFAVSVDPEILVVDETLAVGDRNFQQKCFARVREIMSDSNVTVLFVTHSSGAAKEFCTRGIVLDHGQKLFDGSIAEASVFYSKM